MIKIKNEELAQELIGEVRDFPKYTTQLLNLANQNAQGTKPRVDKEMEFLKYFPKDKDNMHMIFELFSFDNFFRLLLKEGYDYEDALLLVLANCSLSAVVFQERLHNKKYLKLHAEDALSPREAARRSRLFFDILQCIEA